MLVQALVRAHVWLHLLLNGTHRTIESLAQSVGVHPKIVRSGIRMAFLAPDITKAILGGEEPHDFTLKEAVERLPLSWADQQRENFA